MMNEQVQQICQALNKADDIEKENEKAISIVREILNNEMNESVFIYRAYFLYNSTHPKKWIEFDPRLILHPDIYHRRSAISRSEDPDVMLCRKITDKILESILFLYQSRVQTRIIIEFNDNFTNCELKMSISE